jgi:hypothetical protein
MSHPKPLHIRLLHTGRGYPLDILLLLVLTIVLFWPLTQNHHALFMVSGAKLPSQMFMARELADGHFPVQSPAHNLGSLPYYADQVCNPYYPFNVLQALCPGAAQSVSLTSRLISLHIVISMFLAAVFTYLLIRIGMGGRREAAILAAVAYGFGGQYCSHAIHLVWATGMMWFPLQLLFMIRAFTTRKWIYPLLAGFPIALALLSGQHQIFFYQMLALLLLGLVYFISEKGLITRRRIALMLIVALIAGIGMGAVRLLTTADVLAASGRGDWRINNTLVGSFPMAGFVEYVVPYIYGNRYGFDYSVAPSWGVALPPLEHQFYLGLLPLLLLPLAFRGAWNRNRAFALALALLGFLMATGGEFIFSHFLFDWIPGAKYLRLPNRALYLFGFGIVLLSAQGLSDWLDHPDRDYSRYCRFLLISMLVTGCVVLPLLFVLYISRQGLAGGDVAAWVLQATLRSFVVLVASTALIYAWMKHKKPLLIAALLALFIFELFSNDRYVMNFPVMNRLNNWPAHPELAYPKPDFWTVQDFKDGVRMTVTDPDSVRYNRVALTYGIPTLVDSPKYISELAPQSYRDFVENEAMNPLSPCMDKYSVRYIITEPEWTASQEELDKAQLKQLRPGLWLNKNPDERVDEIECEAPGLRKGVIASFASLLTVILALVILTITGKKRHFISGEKS